MNEEQISFEDQNTPEEVKSTLINFLGHTYKQVAQYDSNIISANPFLSPKKNEFKATAERVMSEAMQNGVAPQFQNGQPRVPNIPNRPVVYPQQGNQQQPSNRPYIDTGEVMPPAYNDPNQMEFSFDNSVTAKTINSKLEDIEKKLKRLDNLLSKVVDLLESHESENS